MGFLTTVTGFSILLTVLAGLTCCVLWVVLVMIVWPEPSDERRERMALAEWERED